MPQNPAPIRPRVTDARSYEAALRRAYLRPFVERILQRLANATGTTDVYHALDRELEALIARPRAGVPVEMIEAQIARVERYHRARLIQTFSAALGVDVRAFLTQPAVSAFMTERIGENVDLIKTIPPRFHDGLKGRVAEEFAAAPFDQQRLKTLFRDEYQSAGYNLRRLTRDQTNKQVGGLSRLRHNQLGIQRFIWRTSQDERVRSSHVGYEGNTYAWSEAPEGGPGVPIQCRCTAEPALGPAELERLGAKARVTTPREPRRTFPPKGKARRAMAKRDEQRIEKASADYLQNRIATAQRTALNGFTRGPDRLNIPLRSGLKASPDVALDIARVKKAIAENPVEPPPLVYRGIGSRAGVGRPKVGDVVTLDGFASTSVNPNVAASFGYEVLEIRPKTGVYLKPISGYKSENEWLMDEGRRYRVVGVDEARISGATDKRKRPIIQLEEIDG